MERIRYKSKSVLSQCDNEFYELKEDLGQFWVEVGGAVGISAVRAERRTPPPSGLRGNWGWLTQGSDGRRGPSQPLYVLFYVRALNFFLSMGRGFWVGPASALFDGGERSEPESKRAEAGRRRGNPAGRFAVPVFHFSNLCMH